MGRLPCITTDVATYNGNDHTKQFESMSLPRDNSENQIHGLIIYCYHTGSYDSEVGDCTHSIDLPTVMGSC